MSWPEWGWLGSRVCLWTCLHVLLGISMSVPGGRAVDPHPHFSLCACLCWPLGVRLPHTLYAQVSARVCLFSLQV